MTERISALMDGELPDDEAVRELARLQDDDAARESWETFHLIGDTLRGDLRPSVQAAVKARLAKEPTVLAPRSRRQSSGQLVRYALSAAAGIAGVALVAWMAGPGINPGASPQLAQAPGQPATVPVAGQPAAGAAGRQVESYLFAHQQSSSVLQSVTPVGWTPDNAAREAGR